MSNIIFFDTETTGLPEWGKPSGDNCQPHLVQIAAIVCDAETKEEIDTLDTIIKPDGWEIPADIAEIHGVTNEHAMDAGIPEATAINKLVNLWLENNAKRVCFNRTFDQRIIRIGLKRYFSEALQKQWAGKDDFDCAMLMAKPIMKLEPKNRYGYKTPKLEEAMKFFFDEEIENAHNAMADTKACMRVYWAIKEREGN